jgi:RND superfamily putative drug exporter
LNDADGQRDQANADRELAVQWDMVLTKKSSRTPVPAEAASLPLLDAWTWQDDVFGKRLGSKHTRLIILQLSNEFMATDNIHVLNYLESVLDTVRQQIPEARRQQLQIGFTGSAAVGGDLLRAAQDSIKDTEMFTVIMVVVILGFVYRSPLLIAMPLVTITASLMANSGSSSLGNPT